MISRDLRGIFCFSPWATGLDLSTRGHRALSFRGCRSCQPWSSKLRWGPAALSYCGELPAAARGGLQSSQPPPGDPVVLSRCRWQGPPELPATGGSPKVQSCGWGPTAPSPMGGPFSSQPPVLELWPPRAAGPLQLPATLSGSSGGCWTPHSPFCHSSF